MIPTVPPPAEQSMRTPDNVRPGDVDRSRQAEFEHAMRQRADNGLQEQARQQRRQAALLDPQPRFAPARQTPPLPARTFKPERQVNERQHSTQDSDTPNSQTSTDPGQANASRQPADDKPRDKAKDPPDRADPTQARPDAATVAVAVHKLLVGKQALKALEALLGQAPSMPGQAQGPIEPVALTLAGHTPGDRLLAQLLAEPQAPALKQDLAHLLTAMQARIQSPVSSGGHTSTVLQIRLQHLGTVEIQLAQHRGLLQIEVQASSSALLHLQQARGDLLERLHKLNPGQEIQLAFADSGDADQRSRQRRHLEDEWEPEP